MKKEVLIAVISGLVLGLIITLGIYTANKSLTKIKANRQAQKQDETLPSPPLIQSAKNLKITSHEPFDLINQSGVTISGIAWPNAVVALMTEDTNQLTTADNEGIFTFQFDLIKGFNELTIIATDETSETHTSNLILTYSTTEIELEGQETSFQIVKSAYAQEEATDSSVTDKIKERLQDTAEVGIETIKDEIIAESNLPKKKAFLGEITAIADDSITLKYKTHQFQLNLNDYTEIILNKGKQILDPEDLEVSDFVLSLGFVFPDSPNLSVHKITVIEAPEAPPIRQLITGKIEEIDGNKVVVDAKRITITSKTNLDIKDIEEPKTEDLELDDNLYAIVTLDQNSDIDDVNNVLVIPGKNNPAALEPENINEATDSAETQ